MPPSQPIVSVVMVAFGGGWEWVPRALEALRRHTSEEYEVVLVDNGGVEVPPAVDDAKVELIRNAENVGFGRASNQGADRARGDVLIFLNTDVLVEPGWLPPLLERAPGREVGAVFPAKLNLDGTMQEAGAFVTGEANAFVFGHGDDPDDPAYRFPHEVDFGSAAAMCITRARFASVSGFDPAYRTAYYEDADLCFRLREAGLRPVYEPRSRVRHARSVSAPPSELLDVYAANRDVFLGRWADTVEGRSTYDRIAGSPAAWLAARDLHAHPRVLILENGDVAAAALRTTSAHPWARVTVTGVALESRTLLEAGVEVVRVDDEEGWLAERAGHYSHVVLPPDATPARVEAVRRTQSTAVLLGEAQLERALVD